MKKILVTGSAGFIGMHLVNKLVAEDFEIVGIDNINEYYDINLKYSRLNETGIEKDKIKYGVKIQSKTHKNYHFIKLNLEDENGIEHLFKVEGFNYVCHLAAQAGVRYSISNPKVYIQSNLIGFQNIIENCRDNNVEHFIYASSSSVYGLNSKVPFSLEDKTDTPISLYASTKKSNELVAHTYSHLFNLNTTGLRFFTVYGPWGRPDMALFLFTKAILAKEEINVFNNGEMKRDFTYIDDIINGIFNVLIKFNIKSQPKFQLFNLGNSKPVALIDFIKVIEEKVGVIAKKKLMPIQEGDVVSTFADISKSTEVLGYSPSTKLKVGVGNFIDWYKWYYKNKK